MEDLAQETVVDSGLPKPVGGESARVRGNLVFREQRRQESTGKCLNDASPVNWVGMRGTGYAQVSL